MGVAWRFFGWTLRAPVVKIFLLAFFGSFLLGFIFDLLSASSLKIEAINEFRLPRPKGDGDEVKNDFSNNC